MSPPSPTVRTFDPADSHLVSLWTTGGTIRYRAPAILLRELAGALREHQGLVLAALAAYPGSRREPRADTPTDTDRAEALLAGLPQPLRDHERRRWTGDLAHLWANGINGRDAAREAYELLAKRCEQRLKAACPAVGQET